THARHNSTSLYTGVAIFPMLPPTLSEGLTSLLPDQDRLALVIEVVVGPGGEVSRHDVYRAQVRNHAKLVYETVGVFLEGGAQTVAGPAWIMDQLKLQREAAKRL